MSLGHQACPVCQRVGCPDAPDWSTITGPMVMNKRKWRFLRNFAHGMTLRWVTHTELQLHSPRRRKPWTLHMPHGVLSCKEDGGLLVTRRFCVHMQAALWLLKVIQPPAFEFRTDRKERDAAAWDLARKNEEAELPRLIWDLCALLPNLPTGRRGRPRVQPRQAFASYLITVQRKHGFRYGSGTAGKDLPDFESIGASTIARLGSLPDTQHKLRILQLASCLPASDRVKTGGIDGTGHKTGTDSAYRRETYGAESKHDVIRFVMESSWECYEVNMCPVSYTYRIDSPKQGKTLKHVPKGDLPKAETPLFIPLHNFIAPYFPGLVLSRADKGLNSKANHLWGKYSGIKTVIDLRAVDGLKGSGGADSGRGHKAARDARDERDQDPENWYKEYHKRSHKEGRNYGTKTINGVNLRCAKERNQDNEALARHILDNLRELLYLRYAVGLANDFRPAKAVLDMQPLPDLEKSVREYFALSKGPPSAYEARVVDDAQRIARTRHRE